MSVRRKGKRAAALDPDATLPPVTAKVVAPYLRDEAIDTKDLEDKKLKTKLTKANKLRHHAAARAARNELLLQEEAGLLEAEGIERTYHFKQHDIAKAVDVSSASKVFDLSLDQLGPYRVSYSRNGRFVLIGGRKGHLATFDWTNQRLGCEVQVKESVRDVQWLHNETMFAAAQKKYVYLYDRTGVEVHCLRSHTDVNRLEFLPYHFLLATVGGAGYLKYQDTSTGQLVAQHRTQMGPCHVMRQNPYNAIIHLGHTNGTVTLWSPSMSTPLVKMLCHRSAVTAVAIDQGGYHMVTAGMDDLVRVWDVRTFKPVHTYYSNAPATSLDISQRGLLAVGYGPHVQIWKDALASKASAPYMNHLVAGAVVEDFQFVPFDDVLGIGHSRGFSSILVPGAGEPNVDALTANPFQTKKQRQEAEVKSLLEKLRPEMISLDPTTIGRVDRAPAEVIAEERRKAYEASHPSRKFEPKRKTRGKSSAARRLLRKSANVIDEKRLALKAKLAKDEEERERKRKERSGESVEEPRSALDRFAAKKRPRTVTA